MEKVNNITIHLGGREFTFSDRIPAALTSFVASKYVEIWEKVQKEKNRKDVPPEAALTTVLKEISSFIYKFLGIKHLVDNGKIKYREVMGRKSPFTPEEINELLAAGIDEDFFYFECPEPELMVAFHVISDLRNPFQYATENEKSVMRRSAPFLAIANDPNIQGRVETGLTMMEMQIAQVQSVMIAVEKIMKTIQDKWEIRFGEKITFEDITQSTDQQDTTQGK